MNWLTQIPAGWWTLPIALGLYAVFSLLYEADTKRRARRDAEMKDGGAR